MGIGLRYTAFIASVLLMHATFIVPARAQHPGALERNLPPSAQAPHSHLSSQSTPLSADATSLGVDVVGLRFFGLNGQVIGALHPGIEIDDVEGLPVTDIESAVRPFLDMPLSQKLITQIRTAVVEVYRRAGKPFVSVTIPPQEVTSGVLQLQVVP